MSVTTVKNYADIMELKKAPAYLSSVPFPVVKIESTTGAPDSDTATDKVTVTFSAPKALVPCVVWFSRKYYASVMNIKEFFADNLGKEYQGILSDIFDDKGLRGR